MSTNPFAINLTPTTTEDPAVSTESTETGPQATTAPEGTTPPAEAEEAQQSGGNKEAANYRTKLRAAEAERDGLASTVSRYQRAEVEALAGKKLGSAADLWLTDVKLEDLLTEDGTADPAKVDAAVKAVLTAHPNWAAPRKHAVPRNFGQGQRESVSSVRSMQQIFRGETTR